ncbi:DUF1479-domain-containing protein [Calocera cornea HHB12733]|uniref:DUF1479-domain-containing protein n=1 Tax=Calocera cornea HHB12733 TaxID=1353952 RepID=A0A165CN06_9BASI|nr:DUF1479-domain-containing protein [Calocera cornea HHB12733]
MNGPPPPQPTTRAERLAQADAPNFDESYATMKRGIVAPGDEPAVIASWAEIIEELKGLYEEVKEKGSEIIPQVEFFDLPNLTDAQKAEIRKVGSVVVRNIVPDEQALAWKQGLKDYVDKNPQCVGHPDEDKQFFQIYWSPPQVEARSHPSVLRAISLVNTLWTPPPPGSPWLVSNSTPITWADRFRIRLPQRGKWTRHPPHIDGPSIGRWSDARMRACYEMIFKGRWRENDAFDTERRVRAKSAEGDWDIAPQTVGSCFAAWQGWLSLSSTGPGEGTLKVYPRVQLSNAYILLRPFFRLRSPELDPFDAKSWEFVPNSAHFPGLYPGLSIRVEEDAHPNLRPGELMTCVPKVEPGDMVFWHNDVPHAVEEDHVGANDSSVIYIGALPLTVSNAAYLVKQRECFAKGTKPPDFESAPGNGEADFKGRGGPATLLSAEGRQALGLEPFVEREGMSQGERDAIKAANRLIAV